MDENKTKQKKELNETIRAKYKELREIQNQIYYQEKKLLKFVLFEEQGVQPGLQMMAINLSLNSEYDDEGGTYSYVTPTLICLKIDGQTVSNTTPTNIAEYYDELNENLYDMLDSFSLKEMFELDYRDGTLLISEQGVAYTENNVTENIVEQLNDDFSNLEELLAS